MIIRSLIMKHFFITASFLLLACPLMSQDDQDIDDQTPVTVQEPEAAPDDEGQAPAGETSAPATVPAPKTGNAQPGAQTEADIMPLMKTVKSNFAKGAYEAADKAVAMALGIKSDDFEAVKYKAMIAFKTGNLDVSRQYCDLAQTAKVSDAELNFYHGALLEKMGDYRGAEEKFLTYGEFNAFNPYRKRLEQAADYVHEKAARQRAQKSLTNEQVFTLTPEDSLNVAVVNFANIGTAKDLDPLQKGLAEMIATDLSQVERLTVIERSQMQALVDEMGLSMTGLLEQQNADRMGKLLRASKVVNGSFTSVDGVALRVDAAVADAKNGGVEPVQGVEGTLKDFFKLEKDIVFKIVKELGIVVTDKERKKIEVVPTENVLAFLAYCRGIDAEDRGDFSDAMGFYAQALQADPKFRGAQTAQAQATSNAEYQKAADLTLAGSGQRMTASEFTTPVFTVGAVTFSARGVTSLYTINSVNASFMPEAVVAVSTAQQAIKSFTMPQSSGTIERSSFVEIFNFGFGGGGKSVEVRAPIPDDVH